MRIDQHRRLIGSSFQPFAIDNRLPIGGDFTDVVQADAVHLRDQPVSTAFDFWPVPGIGADGGDSKQVVKPGHKLVTVVAGIIEGLL
jgi:hypothetical protein